MKKIGLLVMAYGTPYKEEDILRYYTDIRHGHAPTQELYDDLAERYRDIGGISPLARITDEQAAALCSSLNSKNEDVQYQVYIGLKHIEPWIEEAVVEMENDGIKEAYGIVLAPQYSGFSTQSYHSRAQKKIDEIGSEIKLTKILRWFEEPKFLDFWANQIKALNHSFTDEQRKNAMYVFSAHSLPVKILKDGDYYPQEVKRTAELIAERAGITNFVVGWQSAGRTADEWIGPDVLDLTRELSENNYTEYIYLPVGFVAEHLEVLYDNDIECKDVVAEIGANYHRLEMPNTDPLFIEALTDIVMKARETNL